MINNLYINNLFPTQFVKVFGVTLVFIFSFGLKAQELFPHNEPASNVPKGVIGIKTFYKTYPEVDLMRRMYAVRIMYGLLPKLTVMGTISATNHHGKDLPPNLVTHTHTGNQTLYSTNNFQRGVVYPYILSGIYLYAKYRFLTFDRKNEHFRMALYSDWSNVGVAHDESEPNLMDDTKGYGGGLIATYLKNHFAVAFTGGVIVPKYYDGYSLDLGGVKVPTRIEYGRAAIYNLSFGYLVYPKQYSDYNQTNINLYVEFIGKSYEAAKVTQFGYVNVPIQTPILSKGNYVEIHPSVQVIFDSNLRIDLSVGFPMINRSYTRFYPVYYLGIQRYFFPMAKKIKTNELKAKIKRYNE
ncbi:MAG: hypothetical protein HYX39_07235 [Bacteroidetes bacterium]|nr:hypothetical protein [Bacteroidota bacterium]